MEQVLQDFGKKHFGGAQLGDERLSKRLVRVADRIAQRPKGSLPDKMASPKELRGLYRLMNHRRVDHKAILQEHYRQTSLAIQEHKGVVLIVHDTTQANLTSKRSLSQEVGQLGNGQGSRGYLCHNSLAVTVTGRPLGLANQILHVRPKRKKEETLARRRNDPNRESRLWVRACQEIGSSPPGQLVVDVVDRGGDTFEFLDHEHDNDRAYVARSHSNRVCQLGHGPAGDDVKLHDHLRSLSAQGTRPLEVMPQPAGKGRPARPGRQTTVAVAWAAVTLPARSPVRRTACTGRCR